MYCVGSTGDDAAGAGRRPAQPAASASRSSGKLSFTFLTDVSILQKYKLKTEMKNRLEIVFHRSRMRSALHGRCRLGYAGRIGASLRGKSNMWGRFSSACLPGGFRGGGSAFCGSPRPDSSFGHLIPAKGGPDAEAVRTTFGRELPVTCRGFGSTVLLLFICAYRLRKKRHVEKRICFLFFRYFFYFCFAPVPSGGKESRKEVSQSLPVRWWVDDGTDPRGGSFAAGRADGSGRRLSCKFRM